MVSLIVAMAANRVIGKSGALPWRLPEDLKRFKRLTLGHPIIMGRKTFESIGRPLPGRENIVVSRAAGYRPAGARAAASLEEALRAAGDGEVFVIGGAELYAQALGRAERIYLTLIHSDFDGDAYFPEFDAAAYSELESETFALPFPHSFKLLVRR